MKLSGNFNNFKKIGAFATNSAIYWAALFPKVFPALFFFGYLLFSENSPKISFPILREKEKKKKKEKKKETNSSFLLLSTLHITSNLTSSSFYFKEIEIQRLHHEYLANWWLLRRIKIPSSI
jgi:hypothetical protein